MAASRRPTVAIFHPLVWMQPQWMQWVTRCSCAAEVKRQCHQIANQLVQISLHWAKSLLIPLKIQSVLPHRSACSPLCVCALTCGHKGQKERQFFMLIDNDCPSVGHIRLLLSVLLLLFILVSCLLLSLLNFFPVFFLLCRIFLGFWLICLLLFFLSQS